MRRRVVIYIFCLITAILICGSIIIAPRLLASGGFACRWGTITYLVCKGLCHQAQERSYGWCGVPMPVCHRCIGIYAGALLGMLVYPFTPYFRKGAYPKLTTFLIFAAPLAIDVLLNLLRIWGGHPYIRTITGAMVAFICTFYIVPGVDEMIGLIFKKKGRAAK